LILSLLQAHWSTGRCKYPGTLANANQFESRGSHVMAEAKVIAFLGALVGVTAVTGCALKVAWERRAADGIAAKDEHVSIGQAIVCCVPPAGLLALAPTVRRQSRSWSDQGDKQFAFAVCAVAVGSVVASFAAAACKRAWIRRNRRRRRA